MRLAAYIRKFVDSYPKGFVIRYIRRFVPEGIRNSLHS